MKTRTELRQQAREFRRDICDQAKCMGASKVPRAYWCPGPSKWLSAGQMAKAIRMVTQAPPEAEFPQSFQSWSPRTAAEIRRWEITPAIHERINARGVIEATERKAEHFHVAN